MSRRGEPRVTRPASCRRCGATFQTAGRYEPLYCRPCRRQAAAARPPRRRLPERIRQLVFTRDGRQCVECGRGEPDVALNCDHILAVARGGTNDLANLQTLCRPCNREKWMGPPVELPSG